MKKLEKKYIIFAITIILILSITFVKKTFQNDTFYTIKIGEFIFNNKIDMLDHFSWHFLPYTYPHWLYDVFIYTIYKYFNYTGIYISTIILFFILNVSFFFVCKKLNKNNIISTIATIIMIIILGSFATARAQLVTYILFIIEVYCLEKLLETGHKKYAITLLIISLLICNIHVAVWPFYFILFLPYIGEYIASLLLDKIKKEKIKNKIIIEKNPNIKYLVAIMLVSILTGLITPIGDTPYTYLINTMMGNSQNYITEHSVIQAMQLPFLIIVVGEILLFSILSKIKIRDLFMTIGLMLMAIISNRHISLFALLGILCFVRACVTFLKQNEIDIDKFVLKKVISKVGILSIFTVFLIVGIFMFKYNTKKDYIDEKLYPVEAAKYIKENLDIKAIRLFNEYDYGSYLILQDIPVFIDSRADLYTKQFSKLNYDILDDFYYSNNNFEQVVNFYNITHILTRKDNNLINILKQNNFKYKIIYEDKRFILYEINA